jgi:hypothetical protein
MVYWLECLPQPDFFGEPPVLHHDTHVFPPGIYMISIVFPGSDAPGTTYRTLVTLWGQRTRLLVAVAAVIVRLASAWLVVRPSGNIFG